MEYELCQTMAWLAYAAGGEVGFILSDDELYGRCTGVLPIIDDWHLRDMMTEQIKEELL